MGGGEKRADTVFLPPLLLSTPRVMHGVGGRVLLHYYTQERTLHRPSPFLPAAGASWVRDREERVMCFGAAAARGKKRERNVTYGI